MCFGCFFLMAAFGLAVGFAASIREDGAVLFPAATRFRVERAYLFLTATFAWLAVISGTFLVYPWYRADTPLHTTDLSHYSRSLLLSNATTVKWHTLGMEWKEDVAFLAPIAVTAVVYVLTRYRETVLRDSLLRRTIMAFSVATIAAAGIAAAVGALLNKLAPTF
jgi:hypothetical protein